MNSHLRKCIENQALSRRYDIWDRNFLASIAFCTNRYHCKTVLAIIVLNIYNDAKQALDFLCVGGK